jgi:hypothetical protein
LRHLFLLVWEENALHVSDYPALFPQLIGMAGISDRHAPELVIGMRRNQ